MSENIQAGGLENYRNGNPKISFRGGRSIRYAGRDQSAAPSTGIKKQHKFEEKMFVSEALFKGELIRIVKNIYFIYL